MDDISALLKREQFSFSYIEQYIVGKYTWEIEKNAVYHFWMFYWQEVKLMVSVLFILKQQ